MHLHIVFSYRTANGDYIEKMYLKCFHDMLQDYKKSLFLYIFVFHHFWAILLLIV